MGGRGGQSGFSNNQFSRIPDVKEFKWVVGRELPQLQGTEKQVKWARQIRNQIGKDLFEYATRRTSDGRPSKLLLVALKGKESIKKDIKDETSYIYDQNVKRQRVKASVDAYVDLAKRIKQFNKIMTSSDSAKFWIDNRPGWTENYLNKKFRKKIDS